MRAKGTIKSRRLLVAMMEALNCSLLSPKQRQPLSSVRRDATRLPLFEFEVSTELSRTTIAEEKHGTVTAVKKPCSFCEGVRPESVKRPDLVEIGVKPGFRHHRLQLARKEIMHACQQCWLRQHAQGTPGRITADHDRMVSRRHPIPANWESGEIERTGTEQTLPKANVTAIREPITK